MITLSLVQKIITDCSFYQICDKYKVLSEVIYSKTHSEVYWLPLLNTRSLKAKKKNIIRKFGPDNCTEMQINNECIS